MRYQSFGCAFMFLMRGEGNKREVLLHIRKNSGYMDGKYDASASGHLEPGETLEECAIRETVEEIGISLQPEELKFGLLCHNTEENYIKVFFTADLPKGQTPQVCEPDKSAGLQWFRLDRLPENIAPFLIEVLECIQHGIYYDDGDFTVLGRIN